MGVCGYFAVSRKCLVVLSLRLLFLLPAGLPVRSQGDSQSDNKVMDNITVRQGETVFLRCSQGDVVTHTAWLNRSSILYAGEDKWSVDPRVSLVVLNEEEFTIKIENVDISDEGQYICAVQTRSRPRTTSVHVIVQVPPKIINLSKDIAVNEGSNVTLMCFANGKPEPTVTWKLLSSTGLVSEDEYLEIPSITRQRAGTYECTAINEVSTDVQTVELTVNYPPSVTEGRDVGVTLGQTGVLQCEADAVPAADFEWYRDDRRLFNDLDSIEIEDNGKISTLTFYNVSEVDYGNYTCVAINKLGSANTSMVLYEVIEPTSSTLLQALSSTTEKTVFTEEMTTSLLDMTTSVIEKTASTDYAIWGGPGAVQDGNSGTMGTHTSTCLLIIIGLQFLLKF
ncbi:neurotrimin isoform X1 [Megalops cyprinoides]|uniref:neurotrimin isoform X1 n=1 Tax=Megalops cyprinoides TaxID=118141 RepID=UPI001863C408|nr:neurotrimin isoform X1 [Megalops cyprinoides]